MTNGRAVVLAIMLRLLLAAAGAGGACGRTPSTTASRAGAATTRGSPAAARAVPDGGAACLEERDACTPLYSTSAPQAPIPGSCCPGLRCTYYTVYDYARCRVPKSAGEACWDDHECASWSCDYAPAPKAVPGRGRVCLPSIGSR